MFRKELIAPPGKKIRLKEYNTAYTGSFKEKEKAQTKLAEDISRLAEYQDVLYAQSQNALLVVIQAMDAAGKDSTIKHVMSGVNPQGCSVVSFKQPSSDELAHDYLWRSVAALPRRGHIGIFNRSYYEEVLVVKVHPEVLAKSRIPKDLITKNIWKERYEDINSFERHLVRNGTRVVKFFLHVSAKVQHERFLERLEKEEKNWKFSAVDLSESRRWKEYMSAYEEAINRTSTKWAPWYIIPADHKWFTRIAVADIILGHLKDLDLQYPKMDKQQAAELAVAKKELLKEK